VGGVDEAEVEAEALTYSEARKSKSL
jgi:hypothetical protein